MARARNWKRIAIVGLAVVGVVATVGMLYASGPEAAGHGEAAAHGSLSPEKLKDLLWRTLNFAALVIILVKFLAKPIANGLKGRQTAIKNQFEELEAQKIEASRKYKEYEAKLTKIEEEISAIVANAVAQGENEKTRIIDEANRAADDIKRQAAMAVQHELASAKLQLRAEAANQAVVLAEAIIAKNLKDADQVALIDNYLDKVGAIQ